MSEAARVALAIDLGGTKVEAALVDEMGIVQHEGRCRHATGREVTPLQLADALRAVIDEALDALGDRQLAGIGIGSAGPIDAVAGAISPLNMPGVRDFAIVDAVSTMYRRGETPGVRLRHDGGCLALAESWVGATVDARCSLSMVVSTGVGGGIVVDGALIGGASGNAGHIGQIHVGELTLEETASGPASVAWARGQGWGGDSGEDLGRDAAAGDALARAAIERSAGAVGRALANASALLDLDVAAISGGFSNAAPDYIELVAASVAHHAQLAQTRRMRVVRSALAGDGPLAGAAALVLGPVA